MLYYMDFLYKLEYIRISFISLTYSRRTSGVRVSRKAHCKVCLMAKAEWVNVNAHVTGLP